jgi:hypothetical protein
MVLKIIFTKELPSDSGFINRSGKPFLPKIDRSLYTATVRSDDLVQIYSGSILVAEGHSKALIQLVKDGYIVLRPK